MKQIILFSQRYLHNNEHDQLHNDIEDLIETETPFKLGISDLYTPYKQARDAEKEALQAEDGSVYTPTITESDGYRDELDLGFELLVGSQLHHFDPEVRESARHVKRIWDQYGNIRKINYNAESAAMTNRNTELTTKYAADVAAMGNGLGTQWLTKMNEANNQFLSHFGERADETAARVAIKVLDARLLVDNAFQEIGTRINALVVVNGEAPYAAFIDKVNYYINYHKDTIAARKGRKKSGEKDSTEVK